MDFSPTTFTIEVKGVPTVAFQTKWQADADQICSDWLDAHWNELSERGPAGIELPPIYKLRLARAPEREAYEVEGTGFEWCGAVKIVNLIKVADPVHTEGERATEIASDKNGAEDVSARDDDGAG